MSNDLIQEAKTANRQQYKKFIERVKAGEVLTPSELKYMGALKADLQDEEMEAVYMTLQEVMDYTGYKQRTIYNAVQKGELLRQENKTFLQSDVAAWLQTKDRTPPGDDSEDEEQDPVYDKKMGEGKYRVFRARREELLVGQLEGSLVSKELIEEQYAARVGEVKSGLLLFSRRVAHLIAAEVGMEIPKVSEIVDGEVHQLLTAMSREIEITVD